MYDLKDTIAAICSAGPSDAARTILRISGPGAVKAARACADGDFSRGGVWRCMVSPGEGIPVPGAVYVFHSPRSYTGDDLVEIHLFANHLLANELLKRVLQCGVRLASPGEFTARAFLNGKIDLTQAEAVAQIVNASNSMQIGAAQRLFAGRLKSGLESARSELLDVLSLIEAGLDFSTEQIEFISNQQAISRIEFIEGRLKGLLELNVSCEEELRLGCVGIAGRSNVGKSSLLNALLGSERAIVSDAHATTRDIVTEILHLRDTSCAIFDCAGFGHFEGNLLDKLGQQAAVDALRKARLVIFCVDMTCSGFEQDVSILDRISPSCMVLAGTKADLIGESERQYKIDVLRQVFGSDPILTSTKGRSGIESLKDAVNARLGAGQSESADAIGLNYRQRECIKEAILNLEQARGEMVSDNHELAAMLLRSAYRTFEDLWPTAVDDAVLERIFSRFCIGK